MRNNFQSLLLVILILTSLLITREAKIKTPIAQQPASFAESVEASSLTSGESASADAKEILPENFPRLNHGSGANLLGNLTITVPQDFLPKNSVPLSQSPTTGEQSSVNYQPSPAVNFKSKIALVSDLDDNTDFIGYNINQRWPLASITKLMTAVLAIEEIGKEKETVVSENAIAAEGDSGKLKAGELRKVEDLIKIMILTSSNDAAAALAEFYAFGLPDFVELMNKKAADLGMSQTVFFDPTGLSPINQSTANDIRKLMKYIALNHPEILDYSREKVFGNLQNINIFAGQSDFLGGKTGYLEEAKENLVSLFSANNRRIIIIVLGSENRFEQTWELFNNYLIQYRNER